MKMRMLTPRKHASRIAWAIGSEWISWAATSSVYPGDEVADHGLEVIGGAEIGAAEVCLDLAVGKRGHRAMFSQRDRGAQALGTGGRYPRRAPQPARSTRSALPEQIRSASSAP
jgi:hypothetical protein